MGCFIFCLRFLPLVLLIFCKSYRRLSYAVFFVYVFPRVLLKNVLEFSTCFASTPSKTMRLTFELLSYWLSQLANWRAANKWAICPIITFLQMSFFLSVCLFMKDTYPAVRLCSGKIQSNSTFADSEWRTARKMTAANAFFHKLHNVHE